MTLAPILTNFPRMVRSDQSLIWLGNAKRLRKLPILYAIANPPQAESRTWLSTKPVDFSAKAVYFMRVLAGFIRPAGKDAARISRYRGK